MSSIGERAGKALYGTQGSAWRAIRWDLDLTPRFFRRLVNEGEPAPDGVLRDIETMLRDRGQAIDTVLEEFINENADRKSLAGSGVSDGGEPEANDETSVRRSEYEPGLSWPGTERAGGNGVHPFGGVPKNAGADAGGDCARTSFYRDQFAVEMTGSAGFIEYWLDGHRIERCRLGTASPPHFDKIIVHPLDAEWLGLNK